jgi:transposase-like protein
MECNRCGEDTTVERYDVDQFTGFLCADCHDAWEELRADG